MCAYLVMVCARTCCEDCICARMLMMVGVHCGVWIVLARVNNGTFVGVWIYLCIRSYVDGV